MYVAFSHVNWRVTPNTVRCNKKSRFNHLLDRCVAMYVVFFHLNLRVAHFIQFDVT